MDNNKATASVDQGIVDARYLRMDVDAFFLGRERSWEIVSRFVEWCSLTFGQSYVMDWDEDGRKRRPERILEHLSLNDQPSVWFEGAVRSERIRNLTSLRKALRNYFSPMNIHTAAETSTDYVDFYRDRKRQLLSGACSWEEMVRRFFDEADRRYLDMAPFPDIQGSAMIFPDHGRQDSYHVDLSIMVSVHSLGSDIHMTADHMAKFLTEQALRYQNVNGYIAVTPLPTTESCCGHMAYFGSFETKDGSHRDAGMEENDWYPYYYIKGAEWFNVLSPLTRGRVPTLLHDAADHPSLKVRELPNGCVTIQVDRPPHQVDVEDLVPVKRLLYKGLYPGMSCFSKLRFWDEDDFSWLSKPRSFWECVPIFEDEIIVTEDMVVFKHAGNKNTLDYLRCF